MSQEQHIPSSNRTAIIIGAGAAGLTAAYELLTRTSTRPIVLGHNAYMGGISRTINYKGNVMDIGGHRLLSKSDRVMDCWLQHLPVGRSGEADLGDEVMLVRSRKSRIYFLRRFFEYPIQLTADPLRKLGLPCTVRIGFKYLCSALLRHAKNIEQFFCYWVRLPLFLTVPVACKTVCPGKVL
ncbi:MAG: NAD(P)-binding protein [Terriglobales bacterium]